MTPKRPDSKRLSSHLESLMVHAPVGFLTADAQGRIVFVNRLIEKMFAYEHGELIGQPVEILIPEHLRDKHVSQRTAFKQQPSSRKMGNGRDLHARRKNGEEFPVEVGLGYANGHEGIMFSAVVVDISYRQKIEREREHLIEELKGALSRVKRLSGMLPICASCKKIRDDKGYWNQIEAYISEHSEADFSHGLCPECANKLYPELGPFND